MEYIKEIQRIIAPVLKYPLTAEVNGVVFDFKLGTYTIRGLASAKVEYVSRTGHLSLPVNRGTYKDVERLLGIDLSTLIETIEEMEVEGGVISDLDEKIPEHSSMGLRLLIEKGIIKGDLSYSMYASGTGQQIEIKIVDIDPETIG